MTYIRSQLVELLRFVVGRHASGQLLALAREREQSHPIAKRRADEPAVRAEAEFLDVARADVWLFDVVSQPRHILVDLVVPRYRVERLLTLTIWVLRSSSVADDDHRVRAVASPAAAARADVQGLLETASLGVAHVDEVALTLASYSRLANRHQCLPNVRSAHVQLHIGGRDVAVRHCVASS